MTIAVNQSRVKAWRTCQRQHWYKYEEKLKRKRIKRPLVFGSITHKMLEAYANADNPFYVLEEVAKKQRKMFAAEIEEYGDIIEVLDTIMKEYFEYWPNKGPNALRYIRKRGTASEHIFDIELIKGVQWKGKVDAFAKYKELSVLVEHKTFSKEWSEDDRWRNVQSITYARASRIMGWIDADAMLWDMICSKPPSVPQVLKSGELSVRSIVTLPSVVLRAIHEARLKPKNYKELLEKAEQDRHRYFHRIITPVNPDVEEHVFSDFTETVLEIAEKHDIKKIRNIGRHCSWCDFEPLCRAALEGSDVEYVKEHDYEPDTGQDYLEENLDR